MNVGLIHPLSYKCITPWILSLHLCMEVVNLLLQIHLFLQLKSGEYNCCGGGFIKSPKSGVTQKSFLKTEQKRKNNNSIKIQRVQLLQWMLVHISEIRNNLELCPKNRKKKGKVILGYSNRKKIQHIDANDQITVCQGLLDSKTSLVWPN